MTPAKPTVLWDVTAVHLRGTGYTVWVARVWWDEVLTTVDAPWMRSELVEVLKHHPHVATLAGTITRPADVRSLPVIEQARWFLTQVRNLTRASTSLEVRVEVEPGQR